VAQIEAWIAGQRNVKATYVDYGEVLAHPVEQARQVNRFLGNRLDVERMAEIVDSSLYRQRR
jgi:hypothetical protein